MGIWRFATCPTLSRVGDGWRAVDAGSARYAQFPQPRGERQRALIHPAAVHVEYARRLGHIRQLEYCRLAEGFFRVVIPRLPVLLHRPPGKLEHLARRFELV